LDKILFSIQSEKTFYKKLLLTQKYFEISTLVKTNQDKNRRMCYIISFFYTAILILKKTKF